MSQPYARSKAGCFFYGGIQQLSKGSPGFLRDKAAMLRDTIDGFGGLVVSLLATGTRVRGFKPGRSRWIFRASGKYSVFLPSEEK